MYGIIFEEALHNSEVDDYWVIDGNDADHHVISHVPCQHEAHHD